MDNIETQKVAKLYEYLNFEPEDKRFPFHELLNSHPESLKEFYLFFNGDIEKIEKYGELFDFYESLYDFARDI